MDTENAGQKNLGPKCRGGKRRTGKRGTYLIGGGKRGTRDPKIWTA